MLRGMRLPRSAWPAALLLVAGCSSGAPARTAPPAPSTHTPSATPSAGPRAHPVLRLRLLPWHTPRPVSRLAVLPGPGRTLLLAGGLVGGTSTGRVEALDTATGGFSARPPLAVPTHDAAALALPGGDFVVGGGRSTTFDLVQRVGRRATPHHLPRPRSDCAGVVAGGTGYVAGGYDGASGSREVLATRDGHHYHGVGRLPVPVRYAAVTFAGGEVLVIGGTAVSGPHAGSPVDLVQRVDPRTGRASVAGHLPAPVQGAVAVKLGEDVYVAGGSSSAASGARASRAVYRLDTATHAVRRAGRLPVAVADAGVAVSGRRAWIIGGESAGRTRSTVQVLDRVRLRTGGHR